MNTATTPRLALSCLLGWLLIGPALLPGHGQEPPRPLPAPAPGADAPAEEPPAPQPIHLTWETYAAVTRVIVHLPEAIPAEGQRFGNSYFLRIKGRNLLAPPQRVPANPLVETVKFLAYADNVSLVFRLSGQVVDVEARTDDHPPQVTLGFIKDRPGRPTGTLTRSRTGDRPPPTGAQPVRTIVLDPGHGGEEQGAIGPTGLTEKEITLDVAKRVRAILQQHPSLKVLLTRDTDQDVPLDDRTALANRSNADLFLSIHANSFPSKAARGSETYILDPAGTNDETRQLAAMENRTFAESYGATKGNRDLELVLWDMAQTQHLFFSSLLAETIQDELNKLAGTFDRGVKEAYFRVLVGATMPAALVEVAYLSNAQEEQLLRTGRFRDRIARALARSILQFRDLYQ